MNIEEIMKPYFDKKSEIESKSNINNKLIDERNFLSLRLERLKDNKDREIAEYIQEEVLSKPGFVGYEAVRKDLEIAYLNKEKELENKIKDLNNNIQNNVSEIDRFSNVDIRELVEVKEQLRKKLLALKKDIELKKEEMNINQSNFLIEDRYNLENQLRKINEYLELLQLTQEETRIIMIPMTSLEKEEYDRRKNTTLQEEFVKPEETVEEIIPSAEPVEKEDETISSDAPIVEDEEIILEPVSIEENKNQVIADSFMDLLKTVYSDVLDCAKKLRSIKLDNDGVTYLSSKNIDDDKYIFAGDLYGYRKEDAIEFPNGVYLYKNDFSKALSKYKRKSKGKTFKVEGYNDVFKITNKTLKKVKDSFKHCSIIELLRERKLSSFDLKRVYGKQEALNYSKEIELGEVTTDLPDGKYINLEQLVSSMKDLFEVKKLSWMEKFSLKLKNNNTQKYINVPMNIAEEEIQEEENDVKTK